MKARLRIAESVHRGERGFSLTGRDTLGRKVRVFVTTRETAEHCRGRIHDGHDLTLEDMLPARAYLRAQMRKGCA